MALTVGSKIGSYEIKAPLGEGGMGVVFRAHDTKLGATSRSRRRRMFSETIRIGWLASSARRKF